MRAAKSNRKLQLASGSCSAGETSAQRRCSYFRRERCVMCVCYVSILPSKRTEDIGEDHRDYAFTRPMDTGKSSTVDVTPAPFAERQGCGQGQKHDRNEHTLVDWDTVQVLYHRDTEDLISHICQLHFDSPPAEQELGNGCADNHYNSVAPASPAAGLIILFHQMPTTTTVALALAQAKLAGRREIAFAVPEKMDIARTTTDVLCAAGFVEIKLAPG